MFQTHDPQNTGMSPSGSSQSLNVPGILGASDAWSASNESVRRSPLHPAFSPYRILCTQGQALLEPFTHIYSVPGKEIRGQMIDAFNLWLNVPEDKLKVITKVVSMLHTASLL